MKESVQNSVTRITATPSTGYFERIRELNDRLRIDGIGGRIVLSAEVAQLGDLEQQVLLELIRSADPHPEDRYGIHDWGEVRFLGKMYQWKITLDTGSSFSDFQPDLADEEAMRIMSVSTLQYDTASSIN